ncbi:uncharacterized protein L201_007816 [Kwoniella dendrophila CBS 6074]|uniref:Uncharacterized protein n=1 Tax=Kwoniella dendrophila CBS 6074 TaxID=1295534 RepID=A0AAX4K7R0_9TREE
MSTGSNRSVEIDGGSLPTTHFNQSHLLRMFAPHCEPTGSGSHELALVRRATGEVITFDQHLELDDTLNSPITFTIKPQRMLGSAGVRGPDGSRQITFSSGHRRTPTQAAINSKIPIYMNFGLWPAELIKRSDCSIFTHTADTAHSENVTVQGHIQETFSFVTLPTQVKSDSEAANIFDDFESTQLTAIPKELDGIHNYIYKEEGPIFSVNTEVDETGTIYRSAAKGLSLLINCNPYSADTRPIDGLERNFDELRTNLEKVFGGDQEVFCAAEIQLGTQNQTQ